MHKTFFAAIAISILACSSCNSTPGSTADKEAESYEKTKETLEEKERKNPIAFLKVSSKDKHNLIGQTVVKGTVSNTAKVCMYKDVQLEISFFSKTGVLLSKESETVYEEIQPGHTADFKSKYFAPKGADSIAIKVLGAKAGN
ncbi:MAG TPA: hypothetical protein PKC39_12760 [Ferruginibacter sp.]|nr:hypothetical protein [Ferruginibacter sp.]HMP21823.1 hypothetical protein [Ferruginibacter sp.]